MKIPTTKKLLLVTAFTLLMVVSIATLAKTSTTSEARTIMLDATSKATSKPKANKATPLTIKKITTTKVKLSWTKDTTMTGYRIYRSTSKSKGYKRIATLKNKVTSYTDKSLSKKKTYYYKIRTYKGKTCSAYSNIVKRTKITK